MARYKIWDKESDIYTLGPIRELAPIIDGKAVQEKAPKRATAQEYIDLVAPWAADPNIKIVVVDGPVNGMIFAEFEALKQHYKTHGARITDDMTDVEVLAAIEAFEDIRPEMLPDASERTAAALEFLAMMSM